VRLQPRHASLFSDRRSSSGSLAMLAAIRRASSRVSKLAARRPGLSAKRSAFLRSGSGQVALVLCALIVFGTAVLGECVFNRMPLPASSCCMPGSYWTVILNGNLYDHSTKPECATGDERHSASNLTFVCRFAALIIKALNDLSLLSAPNK
jgi:hypothetical protein